MEDEEVPEEVVLWDNIIEALKVADVVEKLNQAVAASAKMSQIRSFMGVVKSFSFQQLAKF